MKVFSQLEKKESKIFPRKRFGQHFLVNLKAARRIVDYLELKPDQKVLEIGPGKGVLTRCHLVKAVFFERRKTLVNSLSKSLDFNKDELQIILKDAEIDSQRRGETLSLKELADLASL